MSWTRKLSRQGGTHIVTIPVDTVNALGVSKGDQLLFEQPFSRCLTVFPLDAANLAADSVRTRSFGWVVGRALVDGIIARWAIQESNADATCVGCGFHKASHRIQEVHVCQYCLIEIANGMEFRTRPSQVELGLVSRMPHHAADGGGLV